jgi:hypothetical protein
MKRNVSIYVSALALGAGALLPSAASATRIIDIFTKPGPAIPPDAGQTFAVDSNGISAPVFNVGSVTASFEGISQYDVAAVGRNSIPPDTIGAAGLTQYMQFTNGGVAVFDKITGVRSSFISDMAFWNSVGQAGDPSGDQRVLYNASANQWIALSFGPDTKDILLAVSETSDALGAWKSTIFEGFAPLGAGLRTLADYPTLAMDNNAVYIGTNNFAVDTPGGATNFRGTTLNVIPVSDLFNATGPTTANNVQFITPFDPADPNNDFTRGFAIQGVNSTESTDGIGHIISASINDFGLTRYDVLGAGTAGAVRTATTSTTIGTTYTFNDPARQPAVDIPANRRIIDSFGDQISSSAFEVNGRIYSVHTVTELGSAFTSVRYTVLDTATGAVLDEGNIGGGAYDYYQGSLAVNALGEVVISYNRSGLDPADGRISIFAKTYSTDAAGKLVWSGDEILLRVSDTDDYHNGALFGQPAAGRQRWADYSSVTLDPTDLSSFWVTGTFAREYNLPQFGHPNGTGGSRWGTYIANIRVGNAGAVPEPATWAMMIVGFGLTGVAMRRQRRVAVTYA